jgi:hypothetical protein
MAQDTTPEERQAVADMPIEQPHEQDGLDHSRLLPSLRACWDEHGEGTRLATMAQNGVEPAAVARDLLHDWDGALADERDWNRMGAHALKINARRANGRRPSRRAPLVSFPCSFRSVIA